MMSRPRHAVIMEQTRVTPAGSPTAATTTAAAGPHRRRARQPWRLTLGAAGVKRGAAREAVNVALWLRRGNGWITIACALLIPISF